MPKLLGDVKGYGLFLDQGFETIHAMRELEGKRVEVSIKEYKNTRSDRQNRYWHSVIIHNVMLAFIDKGIKLIGTGKKAHNQAHTAIKMKFLSEEIDFNGTKVKVAGSTADLSLDEFSDLIFIVKDYLLEFYNWPVPEPTEQF